MNVYICALFSVLSAVLGLCYFYQAAYLFLPLIKRRRDPPPAAGEPCSRRYAVLIAARNEQAVLGHLLDSVHAQDLPAGQVTAFVVADNCTDHTAAVARSHGARVFERQDRTRVGKGYALHALLEHMGRTGDLDRYDVFLVFDADNLLCPDYIRRIDRLFAAGYETVCGYRASKNLGTSWVSAGSGLWYLHDSGHLNASRMALGVTCACTGTGFGFTRALLDRMGGWNFFTLVEDLEFDVWCAVNGVRMGCCPEAVVYDEQPVSLRQSWVQRTRWVQGGVQVSLKYAWPLFRGLFSGSLRDRWGRFEALTLTMYGYGACALTGALAAGSALLAGGSWTGLAGPAVSMVGGLFLAGAVTAATERRHIPGLRQRLRCVLAFPLFMLTYIPIALTACFRPFVWKPVYHTAALGIEDMAVTKT